MIICGDALIELRKLPDEFVQCCITSPPYYGLRDYGMSGQLGREKTPGEYVANLIEVFREVRRVLKKDGTLWLVIGDSYAGSGRGDNANGKQGTNKGTRFECPNSGYIPIGLKPKDLIGIPWRVAFALQADGWWLRQDIIWAKPNPMPESVTDRCTKSHEYIFLLAKSQSYYYDAEAISEPLAESSIDRLGQSNLENQIGSYRQPGKINGPMKAVGRTGKTAFRGQGHFRSRKNGPANHEGRDMKEIGAGGINRNRRSVWIITTKPFRDAHFATFPPDLTELMIKAGTSEKGCCPGCGAAWIRIIKHKSSTSGQGPGYLKKSGRNDGGGGRHGTFIDAEFQTIGWRPSCLCKRGEDGWAQHPIPAIILDPFFGAGTTGLIAKQFGRDFIGIDLNPDYCRMAEKRIAQVNYQPLLEMQSCK